MPALKEVNSCLFSLWISNWISNWINPLHLNSWLVFKTGHMRHLRQMRCLTLNPALGTFIRSLSLVLSSVLDHHHGHWRQERRFWVSVFQSVKEDVHGRPVLHLQLSAGLDPGFGPHHYLDLCFCHHVWSDRLQEHLRWGETFPRTDNFKSVIKGNIK